MKKNSDAMGIVDICFNKQGTNLATSCMDSTIRIYDIATRISLANID